MKTSRMQSIAAHCAALFSAAFFAAGAAPVKVAECERDPGLDYWASADSRYCSTVMEEVFSSLGMETEKIPFGADGLVDGTNAEVVCSAFKTERISKNYAFPIQPIGRMHYALYATPDKAMDMMSVKITEWPRMKVGYSPVSQGQNDDRQKYFEHARLSPKYVEYPTSAGAVQGLHDGDIDVLFLYTPFGKRPEGLIEIVPIGDRNVYFAVRKDRPELLEKLAHGYRECYIDRIERFDEWRESILGLARPQKRVRVAAYRRGGLLEIDENGKRFGPLEDWMKTVCSHTRWNLDIVYGGYDESLADVRNGRLDIVGGIGFSPKRRVSYLFPHTPIGMLRVFLWAKKDSPYKAGRPETWRGMKVGLLTGTVSAERAKRQFESEDYGVEHVEFATDREMLEAYFTGKVDACVDVEMPQLADSVAIHLYTSHPMYICTSLKRADIFDELEHALEEVCDDFPKYQRMISEHHYGEHGDMAALSLQETQWLAERRRKNPRVEVDFSPWPWQLKNKKGEIYGFAGMLLNELSGRTGLKFDVAPQTGIQTAEAKFMRGDTDLWIPYPEKNSSAVYGALSVFSLPVPVVYSSEMGVEDQHLEMEMFARRGLDPELVNIIRKVMNDIDPGQIQEMFMKSTAERQVVHRVFGKTGEELSRIITEISAVLFFAVALYGLVMGVLLRRQVKKANRAAALADEHAQAKTRFLAMMSHELRTPLNAVVGFAEFLSRDKLDEKTRGEYTEGILLSSNALLELINDILDLSKLDAGAMDMRKGVCDMNKLLKELPAIFGYRVRRHGVHLRVEVKGGAIPVVALYQQGMRQILINLVGNAAKFTEKGEIAVAASWIAATRTLRVEISDTGCGMSDEKMSKLFNPFVQDIASRMKNQETESRGTGLGLPIVKRMVDSARGAISAQSAIGLGTRFVIDIPDLEVVSEAPADANGPSDAISEVLPERVLVVDDMMMNRKILGIHLGNLGVKDVRYAENGVDALNVMKEWQPDVVLTDMWMPEMDGTQLAEAMRKDRRLAEIPIVAVTADVDVGSTYDLSLFAKVISKPVTSHKLGVLFGRS